MVSHLHCPSSLHTYLRFCKTYRLSLRFEVNIIILPVLHPSCF
nr:MAG TPA: hypothetical protein [Bacteriophage sp.]